MPVALGFKSSWVLHVSFAAPFLGRGVCSESARIPVGGVIFIGIEGGVMSIFGVGSSCLCAVE